MEVSGERMEKLVTTAEAGSVAFINTREVRAGEI